MILCTFEALRYTGMVLVLYEFKPVRNGTAQVQFANKYTCTVQLYMQVCKLKRCSVLVLYAYYASRYAPVYNTGIFLCSISVYTGSSKAYCTGTYRYV